MKALSIRQPWAWCILHARKDIENRTWRTQYRGPLLIHAGARWTAEERRAAESLRAQGIAVPYELPRGALVGIVDVVDCARNEVGRFWAQQGQYGWRLANPRPLRSPIPWRGRLGLFWVQDDVLGAKCSNRAKSRTFVRLSTANTSTTLNRMTSERNADLRNI